MSEAEVAFPKKGLHRQRAHCNPLSDAYIPYPNSPDHVDWSVHFPHYFGGATAATSLRLNTTEHPIEYPAEPVAPELNGRAGRTVDILDIGCGFGGMCYELARQFPDKLVLGLEIRDKVTEFVGKKILAFRAQHAQQSDGPSYENCSVLKTNAMKFLSNYVRKHSVEKMFFLFPDPHFKRATWRRRIITPQLLTTYAYHLRPGIGRVYFATDVFDLFVWMELACEQHPLFERVPDEETQNDPAFRAMFEVTDEGKKAVRLQQKLYGACYRRLHATDAAATAAPHAPFCPSAEST